MFPSREPARRVGEDLALARQAAEIQRDSWLSAVTTHSQDAHSRHRRTNPVLLAPRHRPDHQNQAKLGMWHGLPAPMAIAGSSGQTRWLMFPTSRARRTHPDLIPGFILQE